MQKGHLLEFNCIGCQKPVFFSMFDIEHKPIGCSGCQKEYLFSDVNLLRQLKKFEALCCQIRDSEEILSHTQVGINVGNHQVQVPYRLLLTRLSSKLHLKMGNTSLFISFRFEPTRDTPYKAKDHHLNNTRDRSTGYVA